MQVVFLKTKVLTLPHFSSGVHLNQCVFLFVFIMADFNVQFSRSSLCKSKPAHMLGC